MTRIAIKMVLVFGVATGLFFMCRFFQVPSLYLSMLSAWGGFCFLFSYELAGSRRRVRNGIEEKTPLQMIWMGVGLVCILTAFTVLFLWF